MSIRRVVNYPNVVSTLALVVALSAGAYAAVTLPDNSVGSAQLKQGAVKTTDLGKNAVTTRKVKNRSLRAADLAAGVVPAPVTGSTKKVGSLIFTDPGCPEYLVHTQNITTKRPARLFVLATGNFSANDAVEPFIDNRFDLAVRLAVGVDSLAVGSTVPGWAYSTGQETASVTSGGLVLDAGSGQPFTLQPATTYQLQVVVAVSGNCSNTMAYQDYVTVSHLLIAPS